MTKFGSAGEGRDRERKYKGSGGFGLQILSHKWPSAPPGELAQSLVNSLHTAILLAGGKALRSQISIPTSGRDDEFLPPVPSQSPDAPTASVPNERQPPPPGPIPSRGGKGTVTVLPALSGNPE